MRKFDGKDPVTWILQLEQYFDLHNVQNTQKGTYFNFIFRIQLVCMVSMALLS